MKKRLIRRLRRPVRRRTAERGVALVLVLIFLSLMLLLGLATTMTSITEVSVGRNYKLSIEAFDVADAGASHAYQLVDNMQGDFTFLLRGEDDEVKTGDEFEDYDIKRTYNTDGTIREELSGHNFNPDMVETVPKVPCDSDGVTRSLYKIDGTHFYELIAYDNADDEFSWIDDTLNEHNLDPATPGDPTVDCDSRVLIRSVGYVMATSVDDPGAEFDLDNVIASAVVDVVIGLVPYPAIITNNDLLVQNGVEIRGTYGAVHANDNLALGGGSWEIEQSATFADNDPDDDDSGANDTADHDNVTGFNGPASELYIPDLNPFDTAEDARYIAQEADYIIIQHDAPTSARTALLTAMNANGGNAGTILTGAALNPGSAYFITNNRANPPTYTAAAPSSASSVNFSNGLTGDAEFTINVKDNGDISLTNIPTAPPEGTWTRGKAIFVLQDEGLTNKYVNLNNQDGQISIMTNGSVFMNGNAYVRPSVRIATPEAPPWNLIDLLVMAGEDLKMDGTAGAGDEIEGVMYAHEQFWLSGSGYITGQVVGYDEDLIYDATTMNYITNDGVLTNPSGSAITGTSEVVGNFEVNHSAANGYIGDFAQVAWRQLRDVKPADHLRPEP
jgi:hypothetical protein